MKLLGQLLVIVIVAVAAAGLGFWYGQRHAGSEREEATTEPSAESEKEKAVAQVTVAPARLGSITQTITAYGIVVTPSGDVRIVSVPFESRVAKVLVGPGEQVTPDTLVAAVEPSPDSQLALQEAKTTLTAAEQDFQQVQERFNDHLATNADLLQARSALQSAKLKLQSLTERGVGDAGRKLSAGAAGIVSKIDAQEGQIVPAGGALVEIASANRIEVSLGVEPSEAAHLQPGQPVELTTVDSSNAKHVTGKIRMIGQRVDTTTRLTNVFVSLPDDAHWLLDTFVTGRITRSTDNALLVPREAILPQDNGEMAVFTVKDGHAKKHAVKLGVEDEHDAQIMAEDVKPDDPVVVMGSYELEDGMEVSIQEPATRPAASQPATTGAAQ